MRSRTPRGVTCNPLAADIAMELSTVQLQIWAEKRFYACREIWADGMQRHAMR